jgi:superfamily II DNA or RNA helicase
LPTYDKPRIIGCAEDLTEYIGLPRGCLEDLQRLLASLNIQVSIRDERCVGARLDVRFEGELRPEQVAAAQAMLSHDTGVLAATTAFGKTVVAAWLIAQRSVSTLVLVHRRQLLEQWVERLSSFLNVAAKQIGRIGDGKNKPTGTLDVAVIQSLVHKGEVKDCVQQYGHVIVDECHHLSAQSFEQVVRQAKAKYLLGLSATVARKDGHHPIVFMQCGPIRHRVDAKAQAAARAFQHNVLVRPTSFCPISIADPDVRLQFQSLYGELIADEQRNATICDDVAKAVQEGRSPLVLTERN